MVRSEAFLIKPKCQIHLSQWGEWNYGAKLLKEWELLGESMFIPVGRQTLIKKLVDREVFLMKPKQQHNLSQRGEYVYGAQSW